MNENNALIDYLVEFHATRDFFECHEIMEEYWKSKANDDYAQFWVALIQVAVGQYHDRRNNTKGAKRMYESALSKFQDYITTINEINLYHLCEQIQTRLHSLEMPYYDFNFIINDHKLKNACIKQATSRHLVWGISSDQISNDVINRHRVRDRSAVIAERLTSLKIKEKLRLDKNIKNE